MKYWQPEQHDNKNNIHYFRNFNLGGSGGG